MLTTKMRAVTGIALAATAALAIAGSAQAGQLKPNAADLGDVQLLTTDGNASLVHTIRHADGTWQHFGRIDGYSGVVGLTSVLLSGEENVFFQYTGPNGPQLAHFIRHADGTWNFNAATPALAAGATIDSLSATVVSGNIVLVQLKDGVAKASTQAADGTWSPWTTVPSNGKLRSVAAASSHGTLRIVELSSDGKTVTDFDQYSGGSWNTGTSQSVNSDPNYTASEVAAADDGRGVQVGLIETYFTFNVGVYHSILHDRTGRWDQFAGLQPEIHNYYQAAHVARTPWLGEMQLAFSTPDGKLFHTIRDYNGNWAGAGDVESVAGNVTPSQVTIAGNSY